MVAAVANVSPRVAVMLNVTRPMARGVTMAFVPIKNIQVMNVVPTVNVPITIVLAVCVVMGHAVADVRRATVAIQARQPGFVGR